MAASLGSPPLPPEPLPEPLLAEIPAPLPAPEPLAGAVAGPEPITPAHLERPDGVFLDAWLDVPHAFLERRIFAVVAGFDRFFADERDLGCLRSSSFLRLRSDLRVNEDGSLEPGYSLRADLSLPYIRKRLKRLRIVLENAGRGFVETGPRAITGQDDGGRTDALVRLTLLDTLRSAFDLGGGVIFDLPPGLVARARFRHAHELGKVAMSRIALTGFWNSNDGFGANGSFALERALGSRLLLRWSNGSLVSQVSSGFESGSELALLATLGRYTGLTVLGSAAAVSKPDLVVQTWRVAARLRTNLHNRWVFGEVEPEVRWPLDEAGGRRPTPAVIFRLEVQFEEPPSKTPVAGEGGCGLASKH
jgi:hypothetical protein